MAAAAIATMGGLRVELLDAGQGLGGQYWRHPAPCAGESARQASRRLHHDLTTYDALTRRLAQARAAGLLRYRPDHQVWTAAREPETVVVHAVGRSPSTPTVDASAPGPPERAAEVRGARLLLATGAYDRPLPVPGWDLPGVFTAGGLQALLKGHQVTAGRRVVLGGTGPFLLPVAVGLARSGARVLAVCEAATGAGWARHWRAAAGVPDKLAEGAGYAAALARHRIPVRPRTAVVAVHGTDRVAAVTLARLTADGRVVPGSDRRVECDAVGLGWGFAPQLDLALTLGCRTATAADGAAVVAVDDGLRTSVAGISAAGEISGIGGAVLALREGQLAAEAVLADLGRPPVTPAPGLARARRLVAAHRAFADAMLAAHPLPPRIGDLATSHTLVCRCEEVDAATVGAALAAGADDARQVKQLTRAGMGWCQGRMCTAGVECLLAAARGRPVRVAPAERLVAAPVLLGTLARATRGQE